MHTEGENYWHKKYEELLDAILEYYIAHPDPELKEKIIESAAYRPAITKEEQ